MADRRKGFWRQFYNRNTRLVLTLVSKKWLGFFIATWLVWNNSITAEVWVVAFGIAVAGAITQKKLTVPPDVEESP